MDSNFSDFEDGNDLNGGGFSLAPSPHDFAPLLSSTSELYNMLSEGIPDMPAQFYNDLEAVFNKLGMRTPKQAAKLYHGKDSNDILRACWKRVCSFFPNDLVVQFGFFQQALVKEAERLDRPQQPILAQQIYSLPEPLLMEPSHSAQVPTLTREQFGRRLHEAFGATTTWQVTDQIRDAFFSKGLVNNGMPKLLDNVQYLDTPHSQVTCAFCPTKSYKIHYNSKTSSWILSSFLEHLKNHHTPTGATGGKRPSSSTDTNGPRKSVCTEKERAVNWAFWDRWRKARSSSENNNGSLESDDEGDIARPRNAIGGGHSSDSRRREDSEHGGDDSEHGGGAGQDGGAGQGAGQGAGRDGAGRVNVSGQGEGARQGNAAGQGAGRDGAGRGNASGQGEGARQGNAAGQGAGRDGAGRGNASGQGGGADRGNGAGQGAGRGNGAGQGAARGNAAGQGGSAGRGNGAGQGGGAGRGNGARQGGGAGRGNGAGQGGGSGRDGAGRSNAAGQGGGAGRGNGAGQGAARGNEGSNGTLGGDDASCTSMDVGEGFSVALRIDRGAGAGPPPSRF